MNMFVGIEPAYLISLIFFLSFGYYLFVFISTSVGNAQSKINRDYATTTICLVFFSLFYGLMTIAENEVLTRVFWAGGFISGFMFFPTWIVFLLNMITTGRKLKHRVIKSLFALTTAIPLLCVASNDATITMTTYGNHFSYKGSLFFMTAFILITLLAITILILQLRWWRKAELKRYRKLARIFIITMLIASPVGFFTDLIVPIFAPFTTTPLGPVSILFTSISTYFMMMGNKALNTTMRNVAGYTLSSVMIPILVLDHKNNIGLENNAATSFFGGSVVGKNISDTILFDDEPPEQSFLEHGFTGKVVTVRTPAGIRICDMLLTVERDKLGDALCKVAIFRDITEIEYRDNLLKMVNRVSSTLLEPDTNNSEKDLLMVMGMMAKSVDVDRVYIWKNHLEDGRLYTTQVYEWSESAEPQQGSEYTVDISYDEIAPTWQIALAQGNCINGLVCDMSPSEREHLEAQGIVSILVVPVFLSEHFWGFVGFDDCHNERVFSENEELILRSASKMIANALTRNDMNNNLRETSVQLESALSQANAASMAKSDFLSQMSHEMRTPMNAIIGMTAIGKKAENTDEKNRALNRIENASSHLLGVISDVLDMAKIEANKLELIPVEFNFGKMLEKIIAFVNFRVEEKKQLLTVNVDKKIPHYLMGDDQRLAQVLTNLLSNAIKFTPEGGGIHLEVDLIEEAGGDCELRFEVTDTGIGIAPEQHKRLFHAFEQADSGTSREYGGTGLGLVISKRIIELMGGEIWIESEIGKGARFIFTVKVLRSEKPIRSLLAPGIDWENVRILVVDDMAGTRNKFRYLFDQLEIKCDEATNGAEARHIIKERGFYDIYFIDLHMPGNSGIELTKWIKSHTEIRQSIAVMITASDWGIIAEKAISAGVDMHITKPIFPSMIIDCMNEILRTDSTDSGSIGSIGEFEGKRLLVAEDIEINREILIAMLERTGIAIDCAKNGKEAFDMVKAAPEKYDIVLMDVQMPHMDGFEATRRIRALSAFQSIDLPIIAMTANVFKDDIEKCLAAGMDDHLGKPLDIDCALEKMRKYLSAHSHVAHDR